MHGANFLAILLLLFGLILLWLAYSGNYRATFAALHLPYHSGSAAAPGLSVSV